MTTSATNHNDSIINQYQTITILVIILVIMTISSIISIINITSILSYRQSISSLLPLPALSLT